MKQEQVISKLPKGWEWKNLGDVCEIIMGQSPPSSTYNTDGIGLPFFQGKAEFTELYPIVQKWCSTPNKIAKINDILLSVRAPVGATNVANQECCIGRGLAAIRYKNWKYVFYFLKSIEKQLDKQGTGTTFKAISGVIIRDTKFPYPNEITQQKIVSKIEELFSELDKGIEQLKTAQQQLKTYRQAVLKWAFAGKLTNEYVKDGELPKGWRSSTINDICTNVEYGSAAKSKEQGKIPVLRMGNIQNGRFEWEDLVYTDDDTEIRKYILKKDDVLFNRTNSAELVGKTAIYKGERAAIFAGYLIRINLDSNLMVPDYLNYYLNSKSARQYGNSVRSFGVNQSNINGTKLKTYPIPLAPKDEQYQVVEEIENRLSIADKLEESINQSLQQANALRQSILKRAFEGKLVATDTIETIITFAKVIPDERKTLAGKIIHYLHEDKHFGLTKFQKILYLVENFAQVSYETNYIQERAGPYEAEFTPAFREEMQEKDWVHEEPKRSITRLVPGSNIEQLIKDYATHFRVKEKAISFVLQQLKDKSTHDAELIATLYAVWNNRLINKKPVKIALLVEDFFNWSPKKKEEFQEEEIVTTYNWMKKVKLVPSGFGKLIE